jgi:hypothetical protein
MTRIDITLELPEPLAERARNAGLLDSERIVRWLAGELKRQEALQALQATAEQLSPLEPKLSLEEIESEIRASRASRKRD